MAEKKADGKPILGRLGLSIVATVCGGVLLFGVSSFLNAPQRVAAAANTNSLERHTVQQQQLDAVTRRISEIEGMVGTDAVEIERIKGRIAVIEAIEQDRNNARKSERLDDRYVELLEALKKGGQ